MEIITGCIEIKNDKFFFIKSFVKIQKKNENIFE